jgi:hypothetical protein
MEKHTRQSADIPKWSALLIEAVNKPGLIMKAYSNFHSYSLANPFAGACAVSDARVAAWANQYVSEMSWPMS